MTDRLTLGRLAWLVSLGVISVVVERSFNWSLQMPGHHGVETMAILMLARLSCSNRWSATIAAASAAVVAPALGAAHGPLMALFYLLPGALLDIGYRLRPGRSLLVIYLPLVSAIAWASKPALRVLANTTLGMQFGSLRAGPVYPILTHVAFGLAGGLVAVALWRMTQRAAHN